MWSTLRRSAVFWTALAIIFIEVFIAVTQPPAHRRGLVQRVMDSIDLQRHQAETLILGDCLAEQLARRIAQRDDKLFLSLATNGSLETAGDYYLLRRYLQRHPPPKRVILFTRRPDVGDLNQVYTENHVQRHFLRWSEILGLGLQKRSLGFFLGMLAYKLLPSYRHRQVLRQAHLHLNAPPALDINRQRQRKKIAAMEREWFGRLSRWLSPPEHPSIAARYLEEMARLLLQRGIQLIYVPTPTWQVTPTGGARPGLGPPVDQAAVLRALQQRYPNFSFTPPKTYPRDHFDDHTQFNPKHVEDIVDDYHELFQRLARAPGSQPLTGP